MYTDFPKLTRCCFCIPLRYGLQVWGYIKLLLDMALLIKIFPKPWIYLLEDPLVSPFLIFVLVNIATDIIFSVFLVIATHKKQEKLFKFYIIYSMVLIGMTGSGFMLNLVTVIESIYFYYNAGFLSRSAVHAPLINAFVLIGLTVIQVYIILLVRTELHKLRDNTNVQFVNHTCDPQVNMTIVKTVTSV